MKLGNHEIKAGYEAQVAALIKRRKAQLANMMDESPGTEKAACMAYRLVKMSTARMLRAMNSEKAFNEMMEGIVGNPVTPEYIELYKERFEFDIECARARFGGLSKVDEEAMRAVFNAKIEILKAGPLPSYIHGGVIGEYTIEKDGTKKYIK